MQHAELLLRINASSLLPIRDRRAAVRTSFDALGCFLSGLLGMPSALHAASCVSLTRMLPLEQQDGCRHRRAKARVFKTFS